VVGIGTVGEQRSSPLTTRLAVVGEKHAPSDASALIPAALRPRRSRRAGRSRRGGQVDLPAPAADGLKKRRSRSGAVHLAELPAET
jgi:hypothetical protein